MQSKKSQAVVALAVALLFLSFLGIRGWQNELKSSPSLQQSAVLSGVPSAISSQAAIAEQPLSSSDQITARDRKLDLMLVEILKSKNDNDPRLDSEFKHLSPGTKALLEKRYGTYPAEAHNERGTIIFILGRDLANSGSAEDFGFYEQVTHEPPCLSLGDCGKIMKTAPEDAHEESTIGVTLSYPQQMLVRELGEFVTQNLDNPLRPEALHSLQELSRSPVASVALRAQKILTQLEN